MGRWVSGGGCQGFKALVELCCRQLVPPKLSDDLLVVTCGNDWFWI